MLKEGAAVAEGKEQTRLVWDLPLRAFHWLLVAAVATSWLTHELGVEYFDWHVRAGYVTLVLVAFRIAWGFVGPRHARFADFLRGPRGILAYLRSARRGGGAVPVGHNPLGGLSILALLALLLFQALTGLFSNDEIYNSGPLYGYVSDGQSDRLTSLHKQNFDWLLAFIGLHLVAVAWYQWVRKQDLIRPMLTGRKPAALVPPSEEIPGQRLWLAAVLVALAATALWRVIATAPSASMSFY
jgi:cytochrome b